MSPRWPLFLSGLLFVNGCLYHAEEHADQSLIAVVAHPFDPAPPDSNEPIVPPAKPETRVGPTLPAAETDLQTTAFMQADKDTSKITEITGRLKVPEAVPGAEAPPIQLPKDPVQRHAAIQRLYPPLPALSEGPTPGPGPDGKPYSLAILQHIAASNSPTLRQAAANVEQARGNFQQAGAYPNPTVGYTVQPSNDGSTPGVQGLFIDQVVQTTGKLKLQQAAAEMDLKNAELAFKRARSDLSTQVRNAYFAVLVARETVRVNLALARFTDEVYLIQTELLENGFAATYEPAALRAQSYTTRLALAQAIQTYIYSWKQLVAVIGLHQLPLSEVAGRIDRAIPMYDYDQVLAHVLRNHTDVLTTGNTVDKARYNLKAAQVTPIPNVEFNIQVLKEYALPPKQILPSVSVGVPLPVWDKNKGAIYAAEAALMAATEEPHRVELALTNNLANAYMGYKNNLAALEYYRKYILPDQVRYYRGVYQRRPIDLAGVGFGDLVQAQQTLASNVSSYLTVLGQLWTSVVSVADLLQTDDLFQLAQPHELPELPDLEHLPPWICHHACGLPADTVPPGPPAAPPAPAEAAILPSPRPEKSAR
jgi:cobalt-zinc-cadmium efflux system outer membrane protein